MKYLNRILFFAAIITVVVAGCKKVADLPFYNDGSVVALTASKTTLMPMPADSTKDVVTLVPNWPPTESISKRYFTVLESVA